MSVLSQREGAPADQQIGVLIARSRRAELFRQPDGSVLKRYATDNAQARVRHDQRSIPYLSEHFGDVVFEGWSYRTAKLLASDADAGTIRMEYIPGQPLFAFPRAKILFGLQRPQHHDRPGRPEGRRH
jgi:hypothetical protein